MRRLLTAVFSFVLLMFLSAFPMRVWATGQFQTDYDIQYAISPTGKTIVTQHVTLTNKMPDFYPREYSLLLDSDKISNVIAYDDGGLITPKISVNEGKTEIALRFNAKAVGLGKALTFSLRYEHAGVANKAGSIWEIYIPGVVNDPDIGRYDVTLSVPASFGPAAYLSPLPSHGTTWSKEQMIRGGVAGAYGSMQRFDVTVSYLLTNDGSVAEEQAVALPPETAFQDVTLSTIDPKPVNVARDNDGNWLAYFSVPPKQPLSVKARLAVSTYLSPRQSYVPKNADTGSYTKAQPYWDSDNPTIQALARQYATPRAIYDYVATALSYDYAKINADAARMGAVAALSKPKEAVCMEFTDLFIAIARAAGIPARRVVGYAYTNNPKLRPLSLSSDVLHAWPEYYDSEEQRWIPVDPTWANTTGGVDYFTKLDFNHIVFAINGTDSTLPYPAGYYRNPGKIGRDVTVEFSQSEKPLQTASVVTSVEFPDTVSAGQTVQGTVVVTNKGGGSAGTVDVSVFSKIGGVALDSRIDELLPYAVKRVPFTAKFPQSFQNQKGQVTVTVNGSLVTKTFTVRPFLWLIAAGGGMIVLAIATLVKLLSITVWKRSKR